LKERIECQNIHLENDANAVAWGEAVAGAAKGTAHSVMITLGTGVGGGAVIDHKLYSGFNYAGAELGHMVIVAGGRPCTCGRRGCWEAYASATALIRQTGQAALAHPESLLASIPAQDINGRTAFDAAEQGDAAARAVVARYCEYVAAGLTDLVNALAPERILLGGGISRQGESLLGPVREYVAAHCFGQRQGAIPVIAEAKLGNEAGIIGAAAL
jgi:glucokinase